VFAGNATFTIINEKTGNRFTYKVTQPKDLLPEYKGVWFIKVLYGKDNNTSYLFLGTVFEYTDDALGLNLHRKKGKFYRHSRVSNFTTNGTCVKVFQFFLTYRHQLPEFIKVYHEGKCGYCGRKLTVPESIESGFGPKCTTLMKGVA
jgi:hypothetical protein